MSSFVDFIGKTPITDGIPLLATAGLLGLGAATIKGLMRPEQFKDIPEPPHSSKLWGHIREVHTTPNGRHYGQWFDQYGPTIKVAAPFFAGKLVEQPFDISMLPKLIHVTNCYNYAKSSLVRPFAEMTAGKGIFWAEGDTHKFQRKQLVAAFSQDAVNKMAPAVKDVVAKALTKIHQIIEQGDGVIDVHDMVAKTTLDAFGRVALDHDFDCINDGSPEIREKWFSQGSKHVKESGYTVAAFARAFPWIAHLPLKAIQDYGAIKGVVTPIGQEILANASKNTDASSIKGNDFLSVLLRSGEMTGETLLANVATFIVAGFDSTSASITWGLYYLAKHQDAQTKIREELFALGREPTERELNSMEPFPYFNAVIKEILRMHPVVDTEREVVEDDVIPLRFPIELPDGKRVTEVPVRKGDTIVISMIGSNRLNAVWGDGDAFRPERWLEGGNFPPKDQLPQGWANTTTFSLGPRNCIGLRLALLEIKLIFSALIKTFTFELPWDGFEVEGRYFTTMIPVVKGKEDMGGYMPLRVRPYEA